MLETWCVGLHIQTSFVLGENDENVATKESQWSLNLRIAQVLYVSGFHDIC